jgi:hypothetical protein
VSLSDRLSPVEFTDERPSSERQYYPGLSQPHHWQDAISMLPMEAFDPGVEEQTRAGITERSLRKLPQIQITLTSFQFVLDERDETRGIFLANVAHFQAKQEKKDRERDERQDEPPTSLEELPGELLVAGGKALLIDAPVLHWRARELELQSTPAKQQTPALITEEKKCGLNCQIKAVITYPGNESRQPGHITVIRHIPRVQDLPLQAQIATLVEESIDEFCERVLTTTDVPTEPSY